MRYRPGPMHVMGIALVACLTLAGCAPTEAATPTGIPPLAETAPVSPTGMPKPTNTHYPTMTPSATPGERLWRDVTRRPIPTATLGPTATGYPAPAVPLSPAGPWLVFRGPYSEPASWPCTTYLWAMNQDGTGLTPLTNEPVFAFAVRPTSTIQNGLEIAYVTHHIYGCPNRGNTLKLLSWPGGNARMIVSENLSNVFQPDPLDIETAYSNSGLVWSPSGNKLAFVSAMDDTRLNVFVYDVATEQIRRIAANNDTHDYKLLWSADERYVIHQGFRWAHMSGDIPFDVWSARADASGVIQLVGRLENQYLGDVEYLGWISQAEIMVTFRQWILGESVVNRDIRVINIETGDYTTLLREPEPFLDVAYSSEHNLLLMTKDVEPSPTGY